MFKRIKKAVICGSTLLFLLLSACSSPEGDNLKKLAIDGIKDIKPPEGCEIIEDIKDFKPVTADQSFNERTDMRTSVMFADIAIAEDALYLNNSDLLIYYDKKTGNSNILCGKPDCEHISEECNGCVFFSHNIHYYDGNLYSVINYYSLVRISSDGVVREDLGKLNKSDVLSGGSIKWYIHRGYIYYWYTSGTSAGNNDTYYINGSNCIYRKALDKESEPECIMALPIEEFSASHTFVGVGSYLYIIIDNAGIYRYNMESNKVEWFKELGNEIYGAAIFDNKIYYGHYDKDKKSTIIYSYDLKSNEKTVFLETDKETWINGFDEDFIYAGYEYSDNKWKTDVINRRGECIAVLPDWESAEVSELGEKHRMWSITDEDRIYIISHMFLNSSDDNIYTPGISNGYTIIEFVDKEDILDGEYEVKDWSRILDEKQ